MLARTALLGAVAASLSAASTAAPPGRSDDITARAIAYLKAQESVMQRHSTVKDVDRLMRFYGPGYTYRDAGAQIVVSGLDKIRKGSASHLGESADAVVHVEDAVATNDAVALKVRTSFTLAETGRHVQRTNLVLLKYARGKIVERIDF